MDKDSMLRERKKLIGEIITRMAVAGLPEFLQENIISNLFYFAENDLRVILSAFEEATESKPLIRDASTRYRMFLEELSAKLSDAEISEADAIKAELEAELKMLNTKAGNS